MALCSKVSILTGGPGTGKTTAMRLLIRALAEAKKSFALASPTGRRQRLSEATGSLPAPPRPAPAQGFAFDDKNPLQHDIIIVDEASMLDEVLAYALFRAIDPRSHLLLVGDVDQLPSVGAGDVLRDLIASGQFQVTRLDVIFRQAQDSHIISNAHRVNHGQMPVFPKNAVDFFFFRVDDDAERAGELVVDIVNERAPRRFGANPMTDIQVLTPMYRGPAGVAALNARLQETLNPPGRPLDRVLGGRLYRVGDKVLQTSNNYDKEVFNGDVGIIHSFDLIDQVMSVHYDERLVPYDFVEAQDLLHAYAISVHRSQGSEYPIVVMPIISQHYMLLQRNLLYTAITRAKDVVILVGSQKAIAIAVRNDAVSKRYTALAERLRGEI
jgi:exodeoxyribonuclease V alpha subunit